MGEGWKGESLNLLLPSKVMRGTITSPPKSLSQHDAKTDKNQTTRLGGATSNEVRVTMVVARAGVSSGGGVVLLLLHLIASLTSPPSALVTAAARSRYFNSQALYAHEA